MDSTNTSWLLGDGYDYLVSGFTFRAGRKKLNGPLANVADHHCRLKLERAVRLHFTQNLAV